MAEASPAQPAAAADGAAPPPAAAAEGEAPAAAAPAPPVDVKGTPADPKHLALLRSYFPYEAAEIAREEHRGLTLRQFRQIIGFVSEHCGEWKDTSSGEALELQSITFYQLADWLLRPACHGLETGRSMAELMTSHERAELPQTAPWYVVHWWGESVVGVWESIEAHMQARRDDLGLDTLTEDTPYWLYAFAARLGDPVLQEHFVDPRHTGCGLAMKHAAGMLVVVNGEEGESSGTPFRRSWCLFEMYSGALVHKKLLDIAAYDSDGAVVVADGLTPEEKTSEREKAGKGFHMKYQREAAFPVQAILEAGLELDIEASQASVESDRSGLLNFLAGRDSLEDAPLAEHNSYMKFDLRLRASLALAALPPAIAGSQRRGSNVSWSQLSEAVREDRWRVRIALCMPHCDRLSDIHLTALAHSLPPTLDELDLRVKENTHITDSAVVALAEEMPADLRVLHLDFKGCTGLGNQAVSALAARLPAKLSDLHVSLEDCRNVKSESAGDLAGKVPLKLTNLHLNFSRTDRLDDAVIMALSNHLSGHLKSFQLVLNNCDQLEDDCLESLSAGLARSSSMRTLQIFRLSLGHCKKISDDGLEMLARCIPPGLIMLNLNFENCLKVTDVGVAALAGSLPRGLKRVAINLGGTRVREERDQVNRDLSAILSWQASTGALAPPAHVHNPFAGLPAEVVGRPRSGPSSPPDGGNVGASLLPAINASPAGKGPPSGWDFKLPSLGLRLARSQLDSLVSITADQAADTGMVRSQSDPTLRSSTRPPVKWKAKPYRQEDRAAYPRWIPAISGTTGEDMFHRPPEPYRRLTGQKKLKWLP
eukprot:TRINITY_DN33312_c0_g1_i1.p1 TRINITY_DN33312_c0_g1~~TRINITY_DN33312_c0_g1_i1.p1  ORF type:complete len:823 (+),score=145.06 TRINITY_DN33312_c0_g1_i1:114-2582(+)